MNCNKQKGRSVMMKQSWFVAVALFAFILVGCGGTDETVQDQSQSVRPAENSVPVEQQKPQPAAATQSVPPPAEKPEVEQNSSDQALSSFIGAPEPEHKTEHAAVAPIAPASEPSGLGQYEKQIQDLRTENTGLKQKIVKLEEDNRSLASLMNDLEAKLAAEKERADHAVAAAPAPASVSAGISGGGTTITTGNSSTGTGLAAYEDGLKTFNKRKYSAALQSFKNALSSGLSEDMQDNCIYWIGESKFALKNYSEALKNFQNVITIKGSDKKADAQYMIAQTYEKMGSKKKAKAAYEKVVKEYPMSANVKSAKAHWAKL
jgi:TolA-binding protein